MLKHAYDKVTVALLGTLAVTYAALIWLVVPVLPPLPQAVCFVAIISALAFTAICRTDSRRLAKRPGVAVLARRYRLLYAIAAGWFAAYVIGAVIAAVVQPDQDVPDGQPEIVAGRHYLDVHGSLVPVTKAEYEHDTRIWEMSFLSVSMIFHMGNLVVMANAGKAAAAARASAGGGRPVIGRRRHARWVLRLPGHSRAAGWWARHASTCPRSPKSRRTPP